MTFSFLLDDVAAAGIREEFQIWNVILLLAPKVVSHMVLKEHIYLDGDELSGHIHPVVCLEIHNNWFYSAFFMAV